MSRVPKLLHVTADFPDRLNGKKPKAVRSLIATANWAENRIISLNRVVTPWHDRSLTPEESGVSAMAYFGLPFGIGLGVWMNLVARRVAADLERSGWRPDLVHAHKFTIEGLVAQRLSKRWGIPFCVTVRGTTDHRIVSVKPGMRRRYNGLLSEAARVFILTPWSKRRLEQQFSRDIPNAMILPNVCSTFEDIRETVPADVNQFVSLFNFQNIRFKNVDRIFEAIRLLHSNGKCVRLDVIGAADDLELEQMTDVARRHGVHKWVRPMRAMTRDELRVRLPKYAGLVLPSYPETFGLVYIEALSAGIPVIHARNAGIDGYFSDPCIALAVDHRAPAEIAQAIDKLIHDQRMCRRRVHEFVQAGGLDRFCAKQVRRAYFDALAPILHPEPSDAWVASGGHGCLPRRIDSSDDLRGETQLAAMPEADRTLPSRVSNR